MSLRTSLLVNAAAAALFMTWAYLPRWLPQSFSGTIVILNPWLKLFLDYACLATAIALLVLGMKSGQKMALRMRAVAIALAIVGFPLAVLVHGGSQLGAWTIHDSVATTTGEVYTFLDSSFLQGQTMAITRRTKNTASYVQYEILGTTNGDSPRRWLAIVRPNGTAHEGYGQLYLTPDRMIVGVRHTNKCYLAYDSKNGKFIGHGDIEDMSPFLCLDANDILHDVDVEAIKRSLNDLEPDYMGYPKRHSIEAGLKHPNAAVREAAQQILEMMDGVQTEISPN